MKKSIGVWLDTEKAYVITLENGGTKIEKIESEVETRVRYKGETKAYSRLGNQLINPSKKITERRRHQFKHYFENISQCLSEAKEIYLFGPAETKVHFAKYIEKATNLRDRIRKIDSEDHLTENQMIANVKKVFRQKPANMRMRL